MEKQEILKELKGSLEVTWLKRMLVIHTPIYCGAGVLFALAFWGNALGEVWLTVLLGILLALMITFACYGWRFWRIFRHAEHYRFYCPTTRRPIRSFGGKSSSNYYHYFRVTLENQYGRKFNVDTHAIFATGLAVGPRASDYTNHMIMIAYNERTNEVVVID